MLLLLNWLEEWLCNEYLIKMLDWSILIKYTSRSQFLCLLVESMFLLDWGLTFIAHFFIDVSWFFYTEEWAGFLFKLGNASYSQLEGNTSTVKKTMCPQFDTALEIRTGVGWERDSENLYN